MKEFTILFIYKNESHQAEVLKKEKVEKTEYDVRPVAPVIVRKFGRQIRIMKEYGNYCTNHLMETDYKDLFHGLVNAIQKYENIIPAYRK